MKRCYGCSPAVRSLAGLGLFLGLLSCGIGPTAAAAPGAGAGSAFSPSKPTLSALQVPRGGSQRQVGSDALEATKARRKSKGKKRSRQNRGRVGSKTETTSAISANDTACTDMLSTSRKASKGTTEASKLPTVTSVLLPRSVSIPQLIRLLSATILSASLCACFGTAGLPYENAVRTTLGRYPLRDNPWSWANIMAMLANSADGGDSVAKINDSLPKLLPLDHFLARKIAQSKRDILPPKHLPASGPLLGCFLALLLNIGLTILLPRWIVAFDVLLNYRRIDVDLLAESGDSPKIRQYLENGELSSEEDDPFYRSNLLSRPGNGGTDGSDPNTGVGVLVRLPEAERTSTRDKQQQTIYWLHSCDEPVTQMGGENGDAGRHKKRRYYFEHSQRRIYFDPNTGRCTDGGPRLHVDCTVHQLLNEHAKRGLSNAKILDMAKARYGKYNSFVLPQPTIQLAFGARISSPLAVLQLLGRLLSILEDHVLSSLARLAMTLGHHFVAARRSIVASKELAAEVRANAEQVGETKVHVLRPGKGGKIDATDAQWQLLAASELLPGDVFYLQGAGAGKTLHMPVDALILDGGCVTNEAVLTGESVPQVKRPLDVSDACERKGMEFDMEGDHRGSVLFAGTSLLHCDGVVESDEEIPFPTGIANAVKCLALRTGSYSSEGEIVRSLSKSAGHYGQISNADTESDALKLIGALSGFALLSCASLFIPLPGQTKSKSTSPFRSLIQCTRILMASIPSDIPLAISSIAAACTDNLRKEAEVVCSEPGSLLTSAHVDMVVLDKTGTITAETQSLKEIVAPPRQGAEQSGLVDAILAGCHSLETIEETIASVGISERVIGDPVDLACLEHAGWKYRGGQNKTACATSKSLKSDSPVQVWQIKTFPFDASRRCSSALLLVLDASGRFRLLKTVKGAPDAMRSKLRSGGTDQQEWYDEKVGSLSAQGARLITLAAKEVQPDDVIVTSVFPKGLSSLARSTKRSGEVGENTNAAIRHAQAKASKDIHRDDIEGGILDFIGIAYFSAGIRPSTPRVIDQLQGAGIRTMMLTGDGVDAAVSIAEQAGIIKSSITKKNKEKKKKRRGQARRSANVAILEVNLSGQVPQLIWKISREKSRKRRDNQYLEATPSITAQFLSEASRGERFIACSGEAVDVVLSRGNLDRVSTLIKHRLSDVAVIARASPSTKENVVRYLRRSQTVMMTGDGTNDVNAMKLADVSAALLNGFGSEVSSSTDTEDKRRLQRILKERKKLRKMPSPSSSGNFLTDADSATLTKQRLQAKVNAAVEQFKVTSSFSTLVGDLRTIFKEERLRKSALKKGGGEAARILAKEEKLRASLAEKSNDAESVLVDDDNTCSGEEQLKPGEACLAAACTLLRPSIDGTDAIVRAGIAAAACSLTIHRSIALNALMSCFNLSTLYRDGFRYGKYMWNVESTLISAVDQFAYESACAMRPKIATVRPETTIFTSAGTLSILGQAFIHLSVLYTGAEFGRRLEEASESSKARGIRVRWAGAGIADALQISGSEGNEGGTGILGRPKFRPNQVTNAVFLLSIFQNAVISIVNHMGAPFYGKILENRKFTLSIMASLLFPILCVSEIFSGINQILQLAPFPSQRVQVTFMMLFALDLVGCFAIERIALFLLSPERSAALKGATDSVRVESSKATTAADKHEVMLLDDEKQNRGLVLRLSLLALSLIGNFWLRSRNE